MKKPNLTSGFLFATRLALVAIFAVIFLSLTATPANAATDGWHIKDDATGGECSVIGNWNAGSKTCTLSQDLSQGIIIDSDGIILDGNNHSVIGASPAIGIRIESKNHVTVKQTGIKNFYMGIQAVNSWNDSFTDNTISGTYMGIRIYNNFRLLSSDTNYIGENHISNNSAGISLYGPFTPSATTTTIDGNIIENGNVGIIFEYAGSVVIINNIISGNRGGISLNGPERDINSIYNNDFINNITQIFKGTGDNVFNLGAPIGGNYWSNFDEPAEGCNDLNNDNFCDSPHVFSGGQDNLPWTKKDGWIMPSNNPPSLSFPTADPYAGDGIDPNSGDTTTEFTFRVVYTDADNNPPSFINTFLFGHATTTIPMSVDTAAEPALQDGNYVNGEQYAATGKREVAGTNYYTFRASDGTSEVVFPQMPNVAGFPLEITSAQINHLPILSYSPDAGYINDGINPDEGYTNTNFAFKIVYTDLDNDLPTDVRTVVFDGSPSAAPAVEISSDAMTLDSSANATLRDGNYTNGEQYVLTKSFPVGIYRYRFQVSVTGIGTMILDGIGDETGPGKEQRFWVIENQPPVASFTFTPQNPKVGEQIAFNAASSTDLDGAIALYGWDWESDGLIDIYSETPFVQYSGFLEGTFTTTLHVTDNKGAVGSISAVVSVAPTNKSTASASILDAFCSAFGGWWCGDTINKDEKDINTLDEWLRDENGDGVADTNTTSFSWLKGTKCGGAGTSLKQKECLISALNTKFTSESGLTYKAYILSVITEQKMVEKAFITQTPDPYRLYMNLLLDWLPFTSAADIFYNDITSDGIRTFLIETAPSLSFSAADVFTYGSSFLSMVTTAKKLDAAFDKMDDWKYQSALSAYLLHRGFGGDPMYAWDGFAKPILTTQMSNEMLEETRIKFEEWWQKYYVGIQNKYGDPVFDAFGLNNHFKQDLKKDIKALILFAVKNIKNK